MHSVALLRITINVTYEKGLLGLYSHTGCYILHSNKPDEFGLSSKVLKLSSYICQTLLACMQIQLKSPQAINSFFVSRVREEKLFTRRLQLWKCLTLFLFYCRVVVQVQALFSVGFNHCHILHLGIFNSDWSQMERNQIPEACNLHVICSQNLSELL